jgi:tripartite-type tricarboxylate transporter receptor subunit TctC
MAQAIRRTVYFFLLSLSLSLSLSPAVFAQAPFYQGKTITIIVGTKAGDAYDLYARLIALSKTWLGQARL